METKTSSNTYTPRNWNVWREVDLGSHGSTNNLFPNLLKKGVLIDASILDGFFYDKPNLSLKGREKFVKISVQDLGLYPGATYYEVYSSAKAQGLKPLSVYSGLALCEEHSGFEKEHSIIPICDLPIDLLRSREVNTLHILTSGKVKALVNFFPGGEFLSPTETLIFSLPS